MRTFVIFETGILRKILIFTKLRNFREVSWKLRSFVKIKIFCIGKIKIFRKIQVSKITKLRKFHETSRFLRNFVKNFTKLRENYETSWKLRNFVIFFSKKIRSWKLRIFSKSSLKNYETSQFSRNFALFTKFRENCEVS